MINFNNFNELDLEWVKGSDLREGDKFFGYKTTLELGITFYCGYYLEVLKVEGTKIYYKYIYPNEERKYESAWIPGKFYCYGRLKENNSIQTLSNPICCGQEMSWISCALKCEKCWKVL